jgi:nucleotide-binding universal stress UspA family protein
MAIEHGRQWAEALGVELVVCQRRPGAAEAGGRNVQVPRTFRPARVAARLVVVDAAAGHVRWRVRSAASPLLIARPSPSTGRILVALDLNDPAEHALELIARLAHARQAEVTLLHSIEPGIHAVQWLADFAGSTAEFVAQNVDDVRAAATTRLSELLGRYDLRGDVRIGDGPAARFILDEAARLKPELIALGAPRHHGLLHLVLRTTADEVAASAPGSVLVVPHRAHLQMPE